MRRAHVLLSLTFLQALVVSPPTKNALFAAEKEQASKKPTGPRTDRYGDPLPEGALVRMGTTRLRHGDYAAVAFSSDGKAVISANPAVVRLWDPATGKLLRRIDLERSPESYPGLCALSPDGKIMLGQQGQALRVWDVATGKKLRSLPLGGLAIMRIALAPDGKTAVMAGAGPYTIHGWDVATGKQAFRLEPKQWVEGIVFSPLGKQLASVSNDGVSLWDTGTGKEIRKLAGKRMGLAFSPDGKTLTSGLNDGTVKLWDVASGKEQGTLREGPSGGLIAMRFSADGATLAAATQKDLVLWSVATRKRRHRLEQPFAYDLAFSPDSKTLATSSGGTIRLWDVTTGRPLHARHGHEGEVDSVAVSADGRVLASASRYEDTVRFWEMATGKPLGRMPHGHDLYVRDIAFSADGKLLVCGGGDGTLRLWDIAAGKERHKFSIEDLNRGSEQPKFGKPQVMAFRLSADGKWLAAVSVVGEVERYQINGWEAATGKLVVCRLFLGNYQSCLGPDGRSVARRTHKGLIIEDVATGEDLVTLPGDSWSLPAFSPDGRILAAARFQRLINQGASEVKDVSLWELATGRELLRIETGPVGLMAFSPDGRALATAGLDAICVWDLATGRKLFRRPRHEDLRGSHGSSFVSCLAFAPDGRTLATGLRDSTVLVWDLKPATWRAGAAARDLSPRDLDRLWADLAGDSGKAWRAIGVLAATPGRAVPFFKDHLRPAAAVEPGRIRRLLADLDSSRFAVREAATKELAGLGERIEPALRQALAANPSPEVKSRVQALLRNALLAARGVVHSAETLRALRAAQALEWIGTPEAGRVLKGLARGAAEARLTQEAQASLERLARRPGSR